MISSQGQTLKQFAIIMQITTRTTTDLSMPSEITTPILAAGLPLVFSAITISSTSPAFRTGQLLDSDAENKTYAGDWALLDYLDGYASTKLAADGSDAFARAQSHTRATPLPMRPKE